MDEIERLSRELAKAIYLEAVSAKLIDVIADMVECRARELVGLYTAILEEDRAEVEQVDVSLSRKMTLEGAKKHAVLWALWRNKWNKTAAARDLGVDVKTVYRLMEKAELFDRFVFPEGGDDENHHSNNGTGSDARGMRRMRKLE